MPVLLKPYSLPYAMIDVVSKVLHELEARGKIEKVSFSRWAFPCIPVKKPDGTFRLCIDFKKSVNRFLEVNVCPLPRIDEIFSTLNGGSVFCVVDLADAYTQLAAEKDSQELLTINTHRVLSF